MSLATIITLLEEEQTRLESLHGQLQAEFRRVDAELRKTFTELANIYKALGAFRNSGIVVEKVITVGEQARRDRISAAHKQRWEELHRQAKVEGEVAELQGLFDKEPGGGEGEP